LRTAEVPGALMAKIEIMIMLAPRLPANISTKCSIYFKRGVDFFCITVTLKLNFKRIYLFLLICFILYRLFINVYF